MPPIGKEMEYMRNVTFLVLVCLLNVCANRSVPDYSVVPAHVPKEAKPVWVMLLAAQKSDFDMLLSVCTPERVSEVKRALAPAVFKELTAVIPQGGLDAIDLRVSRSSKEVMAVLGIPDGGKDYVAQPGFAYVLIGNKTCLPVTQRDGIWLLEAISRNEKEGWIVK
jgi:hypothetical protein